MAVSEFVRGSTLALPAQQCNRFGVSRKRIDVVRDERPSNRRAADQRDELVLLHSITSSARASSVGGTVKARWRAKLKTAALLPSKSAKEKGPARKQGP
jgi:hypothetical protein